MNFLSGCLPGPNRPVADESAFRTLRYVLRSVKLGMEAVLERSGGLIRSLASIPFHLWALALRQIQSASIVTLGARGSEGLWLGGLVARGLVTRRFRTRRTGRQQLKNSFPDCNQKTEYGDLIAIKKGAVKLETEPESRYLANRHEGN